MSILPNADSFFHSRQQFQIILTRVELLADDLEVEPKPALETVKKHLDAILASMNEYAKFLREMQKKVEIKQLDAEVEVLQSKVVAEHSEDLTGPK